MKRSTAWVSITLLVMFLSLLLIPISHATRSNRAASAFNDRQRQDGLDLKRMAALNQPTLPGAQSETLKPISRQAVGFAVSDPVRELAAAPKLETDPREGGEDFEHEINELNAREFKSQRPQAAKLASLDASLQNPKPIESETPSVPSLTFDGLTAADNVPLVGGTVAPSDENLDVGPNDVVQTVNIAFRVYDKNGVPKIPPTLMSSLFSKLGGICANADRGDPVVLYDRMADRWFLTQFAFLGAGQAPPFHQCVAVSQNGDPTGAYYTYDFVTPGAEFPDYGKFGVWPDGYYMTVNQFTEPGDHFNGVGMYALDRQKMLIGDPTASFIYFNLNLAAHPEGVNSTLPSDQDGLEAPPAGAPNTFAYLISDEFEDPGFNVDALKLYDFHADFANPANSTFTERPESPVLVAPFDPRSAPGRADIKEPPPATNADALDSIQYHLMYRLQYMNRGGIETLVSSTTVNVSGVAPTTLANYQAGVRYFQLQRSTPGGPFLLYDNATFSPDAGTPVTGLNRWLPSAAIDHMGNLAVSYSVSSTSVFPSIRYAGRDFNALGGLTGELNMFSGTAVQLGTVNRWGDYQSIQVDPTDDCTFWTTNQYYNTNSQFNWRTRIGRFKFPTCAAPAQGTISGTITACDSGVPLEGAIVELSNGFSTTTKADGTYSFNVAPGTYTATVKGNINRDCTPSASSVVTVTDGNTTTFNTCLDGVAKLFVDTTDPTAVVISGGNGNGIIDPNECNTMTIRLDNIGCAPARNIQTTLSTITPGVTITQSHSPYPDIPIDGSATNLVEYSISTDPSFVCGTTIQFSQAATFTGGADINIIGIPTCGELKPNQTVTGSIDPSDAKTTNAANRLGRNGIASTCSGKACPGSFTTGQRSYDQYAFTNDSTLAACATISLTSANGPALLGSAYLGSFDPSNLCTNYLGDAGSALGNNPFSVTVPPSSTLVVVVMETAGGTPSTPYSVTVSGLRAAPPAGNGVCQACSITPLPNITVSNDPNQCGAVVTYPVPTTSGTCGIVSASPASGTFFPVGTTTVTISTTAGATSTFTVTVNDTQPPTITCPANIVAQTAPNATSAVVNYAATGSDNCAGNVLSYNPPSGSTFPLGTTTVTATNTDASGNTATCSFTVTVRQPQTIQFNAAALNVPEAGEAVNVIVTRTGGSVGDATVDYATSDGTADQRTDYTIKLGTLHFADGETSKIIAVPIVDDVFVEGDETFTLTLSNVTGSSASLGSQATTTITIMDNDVSAPTSNPIDDSEFFVHQHYLDFLNRLPDNPGLTFWTNGILACGTDAACIELRRVLTSSAFFLSIEFQETGGFAIRTNRVAFSRKSAEAATRLTYLELIR
ncbi:MAG TPA: HYR domain-containing protein, partial [Pyrinomonadaceae bacterium]|nr:HYR domain-containing protein [Pyrinomonadaceae bacterium]